MLKTFSKCKGFLLIELLVTIAIATGIILLMGQYYLQISLYKRAAGQLCMATDICTNELEKIFNSKSRPKAISKWKNDFEITINIIDGPIKAFGYVSVAVAWNSVLGQKKLITMETVCVY